MQNGNACNIEGCDRAVFVRSRGWCKRHYNQWWHHGSPTALGKRVVLETQEAFMHKIVLDPHGCWIWQGAYSTYGYGKTKVRGKHYATHRLYYEFFVGPIPEGLHLDHLCRNKKCCNPEHLEPVTPKENVHRGFLHDLRPCWLTIQRINQHRHVPIQ